MNAKVLTMVMMLAMLASPMLVAAAVDLNQAPSAADQATFDQFSDFMLFLSTLMRFKFLWK